VKDQAAPVAIAEAGVDASSANAEPVEAAKAPEEAPAEPGA